MSDPFAPEPYLNHGQALVAAALGRRGGSVERARPCQVAYRPGRSITVAYEARVGWHGRPARPDRVVVRAARRPLRGAEPVAEDARGNPVHAFVASEDPALPGLRRALDAARVGDLLADLGLGERGGPVHLELRSHRPLRRAVIGATGPHGDLFIKVVPPRSTEDLHRRHRLFEGVLPVPRSAGFTDDGIVVLQALPGRTLREQLLGEGELPALTAVEDLLDRLPPGLTDLPGPPTAHDRVGDHAELLGAVVPTEADRLARLSAGIAELCVDDPMSDPSPVPVHGDLYEAQLLADGGRIVGLLDVDGTGAGRRLDDLANMLGHLSVLARARGSRRGERIGDEWIRSVDGSRRFDPAVLRAEIAAVVVGLATGCFRVQERHWERHTVERIDLAEAWVSSARRARGVRANAPVRTGSTTPSEPRRGRTRPHERSLTGASGRSQTRPSPCRQAT